MKFGFIFRIVLSRHYWKRYALALESQLEGEKVRNQEREDTLLNMIPHILGVFGPRVRDGRAQPVAPLRRQVGQRKSPVDPWALLTEEEQAEWPTYWALVKETEPNANERTIRREFEQMIQVRRQEEGVEIM